ncbi:hypothetical protein E1286_04475 [Nonomuraea terrae]|uniref:Uncharacterized protein n=1 Tax=Nonomuraea terrae TaxID=2530383 RepID=A0A4R4ZCK0_9ACTN|nr:hypothetical protein [Nonomuraea terrae]TDD54969.1 hypothetical protein E1286_04475 [Nonomuraea terrae]
MTHYREGDLSVLDADVQDPRVQHLVADQHDRKVRAVTPPDSQVALSLATDFENFSVLKPAAHQERAVRAMLDEVVAWGGALKALRDGTAPAGLDART